MFSGAVIEADDRLHPLAKPEHAHHDQHTEAVDDAECSDRQVAPFAHQLVVHDDVDDARRQVHQERGHADRNDVADDPGLRPETTDPEMHLVFGVEKVTHHEQHADKHRDDRRDGRPLDPHIQSENEDRIEAYGIVCALPPNANRISSK